LGVIVEKVFFKGEFGSVCGVLHKVKNSLEIVVVLHGFSSTKESAALQICQELNKIGVSALRIDLDNQGETELDFQTGASIPNYIKQVEAALNYCNFQGYKEISLVGTSYGGSVAFAVALIHPEIKRLCLRVPVVDYKKHVKEKYDSNEIKKFKKQGFVPYYNKDNKRFDVTFDFIEKSYAYSMFENAKKVKIPVLILQGDADEEVNPEDAKTVVLMFSNAKLHIIKGAGHKLDVNGDFSEGLNTLIDFFKKH
jgi:pimeloyl-ACP methyl ester carboxylesterase